MVITQPALTAIRHASSLLSNFAANCQAGVVLEINIRPDQGAAKIAKPSAAS